MCITVSVDHILLQYNIIVVDTSKFTVKSKVLNAKLIDIETAETVNIMKVLYWRNVLLVLSALLALYVTQIDSCFIWGTDSGECVTDSLDPAWRAENMPYCQAAIVYPACVPRYTALPPSREYPEGRWYNHTVLTKDNWVRSSAVLHIYSQMRAERNTTLKKRNTDQYGNPGRVRRRFYKKPDCQNAFRNLFCWLNFPRCDPGRDLTLPTCKSACENFFKSCGYERGLWRCGQSKYFNGYEPEPPTMVGGNATYLRDFFPGQPFRKNQFSPRGNQFVVCTPSIDGSASRVKLNTWYILLIVIMACLAQVFFAQTTDRRAVPSTQC